MSADFTLELRRLAGLEPRYAVRFACRNGRAVLASRPVWSVAEATLRSNGHIEGLSTDDVRSGVFVFVGFELADNAKFELWPGDPRSLRELPPGGTWVHITLTPVEQSPFFSLDTDELEFERPWRRRRRRRRAPSTEPATEPGVRRTRWRPSSAMDSVRPSEAYPERDTRVEHSGFYDVPGLSEPLGVVEPSDDCSRWDEGEVLSLPAAGQATHVRQLDDEDAEVDDLLRVVSYLREELRAERDEAHRLQAQVTKLQDAVAALVAQANRG